MDYAREERQAFIQRCKPVIGRDYWPNRTLRQMPRHWHLEETQRQQRYRWYLDSEIWIGAALFALVAWCIVQSALGWR